MTMTFKDFLIESNFNEPEEGKNDVSMNHDEELVDWVLNDEELYNVAQYARSFEELMQDIDALFTYSDEQYYALRRAFNNGDLRDEQQEEEESKMPAVRDRAMVAKGERDRTPTSRGGVTNNKRRAQKAGRTSRSMHGKGTGGGNYLDNLFGRGGRLEDYD